MDKFVYLKQKGSIILTYAEPLAFELFYEAYCFGKFIFNWIVNLWPAQDSTFCHFRPCGWKFLTNISKEVEINNRVDHGCIKMGQTLFYCYVGGILPFFDGSSSQEDTKVKGTWQIIRIWRELSSKISRCLVYLLER